MGHRPQLENLLCKVNEAAPEKPQVTRDRWILHRTQGWWNTGLYAANSNPRSLLRCCSDYFCVVSMCDSFLFSSLFQDESGSSGGISSTSASVNRYILQLAQEYCGDCKNSFDELSKIIQVWCALIWIDSCVSFCHQIQCISEIQSKMLSSVFNDIC